MSFYYGFGKYAERFCKGFCGYYAILLIPGILLRLYDKKWTPADSLLFSFYCVHGVLLVSLTFVNLVFYISPRYLESAQPLMFGWCAYAIVRLWRMIPIIPIRAVGVAALAGLGIFCFRHSLKEIIPFFGDEEERAMRIAIFDFSDEIRSAREGGETPLCGDLVDFDLNEYHPPCATTIRYFHYSGGKWKSCAKRITVLSYFASVRTVGKNADYVCLILPKGIERPKMIGGKGANGKSNWRQLRRVPSEGYDYELWGSVR
ncbi:MAG: hypothetical protein MJ016_05300 [Victivallaceae bacterium]|nr:hypothetical protein [Victivallaceae bacterium]